MEKISGIVEKRFVISAALLICWEAGCIDGATPVDPNLAEVLDRFGQPCDPTLRHDSACGRYLTCRSDIEAVGDGHGSPGGTCSFPECGADPAACDRIYPAEAAAESMACVSGTCIPERELLRGFVPDDIVDSLGAPCMPGPSAPLYCGGRLVCAATSTPGTYRCEFPPECVTDAFCIVTRRGNRCRDGICTWGGC